MRLISVLIILSLLISPLGCATKKHTVQEDSTKIEQEEKKEGSIFTFIGAICLFGLFSAPKDKETEYIYDIEDSYFEPEPKFRKEKR